MHGSDRLCGVVVSMFDCNVVELEVVSYLTDNTMTACPFCFHNNSMEFDYVAACCQYIVHTSGTGGTAATLPKHCEEPHCHTLSCDIVDCTFSYFVCIREAAM